MRGGGVFVGLRGLRQLAPEKIAEMRIVLAQRAKTSKRGEDAVALRRIVLDAISAPTVEDYRAHLRRLPVTIGEFEGQRSGRHGRYRTYAVRGTVRAQLFVLDAPPLSSDKQTESLNHNESEGGEVFAKTTIVVTSSASDCYATYNGDSYEGECATEQEIDDALTTIAALETEAEGDVAEATNACPTLNMDPSSCGPYDSENDILADLAEAAASPGYFEDGRGADNRVHLSSIAACVREPMSVMVVPHEAGGYGPCTSQAIDAAAGIIGWGLAKYGAYALLTAEVAPPVGAVAAAVAGSILAAWSLGSGVSSYLNCRAQH